MKYMEIALLPKSALKIKSKNATFVVDPQDATQYNAGILLGKSGAEVTEHEMVILDGPGEYEVGGVKMTGIKGDGSSVYSMYIDGLDVVLGRISSLEKVQNKLKEHNILVVLCDEAKNASFLTALASNTIILYGEKAGEIAQTFGKETVKQMAKYSTTKDKLPQEVETIVLE